MFWTSCFYVAIALVSLFIITRFKETKPTRRIYSRAEFLSKAKSSDVPQDWSEISKAVPAKLLVSPIPEPKTQSLESFILKEIENSVKELDQKRVPFANLDKNARINRLSPSVTEFLPKVRLNPLAQDFHPY